MASLIVCGAINWDTSCFVEHMPVSGEEVTIKNITRLSGGTGGNVAVAAARILGANEVALIAALGQDDVAHQQIATLNDEGVITEGIDLIQGEESGQAYIFINQEGQNVIASHLGANARLCLEHVNKAQVGRQIKDCKSIVLTDPPMDVATELINLAGKRGVSLLWDPGILVSPNRELVQSLTKKADVLFLNETEANALLGAEELDVHVNRLRELGFRKHIVFKFGAQGAAMVESATGRVSKIPALPLNDLGLSVINTVGCGDVFAGVFAAYRILGSGIRESLVMASAAAGLNATRPETRGSPDRAVLEEAARRSQGFGFTVREHENS